MLYNDINYNSMHHVRRYIEHVKGTVEAPVTFTFNETRENGIIQLFATVSIFLQFVSVLP